MATLTLEELKKQNAEAEARANEAQAKPDVEPEAEELEEEEQETEEETEEEVEAETTEEAEEDGEAEEETEELEAWQQSEESEDSQDGSTGFKPNPAAKKLRLKAKALRDERDEAKSEIEALRAKVEQLERGATAQPKPQQELKRPTLEQFDWDEEKYNAALDDYYDNRMAMHASKSHQQTVQAQQLEAARQAQSASVQKHYDRAAELITKHNIPEEKYADADGLIRSTIESVMPKRGDEVADQLIAKLVDNGEGSEKAWLYLGSNAKELAQLKRSLESDPGGISAAIFMGKLLERATKPIRVKSKAPKPAPKLKGDKAAVRSAARKKYEKTEDVGERVKIKRAASKAGEDVSNW